MRKLRSHRFYEAILGLALAAIATSCTSGKVPTLTEPPKSSAPPIGSLSKDSAEPVLEIANAQKDLLVALSKVSDSEQPTLHSKEFLSKLTSFSSAVESCGPKAASPQKALSKVSGNASCETLQRFSGPETCPSGQVRCSCTYTSSTSDEACQMHACASGGCSFFDVNMVIKKECPDQPDALEIRVTMTCTGG
jgi:hypothetical protein